MKKILVFPYILIGIFFFSYSSAHEILPQPQQLFKGSIGLSAKDSKSDFPKLVTAPKGAPNVLLVMLDDVGFGASETFRGPIHTPTLDHLAQTGLRYNQFHTIPCDLKYQI